MRRRIFQRHKNESDQEDEHEEPTPDKTPGFGPLTEGPQDDTGWMNPQIMIDIEHITHITLQ